MSAYNELERAVIDMRERFLAIGERIAGLLATLARQIDAAPAQARAAIRQAADQIAATQERLRTQVARLPARPEERYQIMRSLLQAQHGALQQLTIIVEQHAPGATGPFAQGAGQPHARVPTAQRGAANAGHASTDAHFEQPMQGEEPAGIPAKAGQARRSMPRHRGRGATLIEVLSSRALAVVAVIIAVAVVGYVYFPGADAPLDRDRSLPTTAAAGDEDDAAADRAAQQDTSKMAERLPQRPLPETASDDPAAPGSGVTLLPDTRLPSLAARRTRDQAPAEQQDPATLSALKPSTPAAESEAAPAEPVRARFVAVVFTHKDAAAALSAFGDLQQRYPGLLTQRKAEAQPIELADKGTWHRLIVLPAGSRQSAAGLCDQLHTAGYDRCWVKAY